MDSSTLASTPSSAPPGPATVAELKSCLKLLRSIRYSSQEFFSQLAEKQVEGGEEECAVFVKKNQEKLEELIKLSKSFQSEISALSTSVPPKQHTFLELVSDNPADDKSDLPHKLAQTYRWIDRLTEAAARASPHLSPSLNRSHLSSPYSSSKKRKLHPTCQHMLVPQQQVDVLINNVSKQFQDMTFTLSRASGNHSVVQVTLGSVLRGVVCLRGLLIESVVIRGYGESNLDSSGRVDASTPSPLLVFQQVSDNATAAMLHFFSPFFADLSIKSFFTWLHSFITLFHSKCSKCDSVCSMTQPPTWREFRTLVAYHQHCRP